MRKTKQNKKLERLAGNPRPSRPRRADLVYSMSEQGGASTREDALEAVLREVLKEVFESELAGHIKYETLTRAVELSNFQVSSLLEDDPPRRRSYHAAGFGMDYDLVSTQKARSLLTAAHGKARRLPRPGYQIPLDDHAVLTNRAGQYEVDYR